MKQRGPRIELALVGLTFLTALAVLGLQPQETAGTADGRERADRRVAERYENSSTKTVVIAHRAGAAKAPENTLAALEGAIAAGADMAEIDVRQTGDGVLIVLHDDSFGRTAGLERKVWDLDCKSAQGLDAGGWYSDEFQGECIPTLEEMLDTAQGRIALMIELKADGCREDLADRTVALIREKGAEEQCVLASSCEGLLQRVKALAPDLETVYIGEHLPEAAADWADGYSLDVNAMTGDAVDEAHAQGKKICAWTVNTRGEIRRALDLGVDGLVTDDPELARNLCQDGLGPEEK